MDDEIDGENGAVDAEASVLLENGEPVAAVVSLREGDEETGGDIGGESTVETELTRIEEIRSETTIAVAAIEADVETARIEADAQRETKWLEEKTALEASITELNLRLAEMEGQLAALPNPSIPTPQPEPEEHQEPVSEIVPEQNLTPQPIPETETLTELGNEGADGSAVTVVIPAPVRKRRRLI